MAAHPVDVYVGRRLKERRTLLGLSQEEVGEAVGVTFQQIQKYERGLNRIGSSRLFEFSRYLGVSIQYFFEGYDYEGDSSSDTQSAQESYAVIDFDKLNNKEVLLLVRAFNGIDNVNVRKRLLALIRSISSTEVSDVEDESLVA
jgi:transcriptional regulator with XRE-family HTH domain